MEAKDTVIKLEHTTNESLRIHMEKMLLQQAEISFKVGERKVVEWIKYGKMKHNNADIYRGESNGQMQFLIPRKDWQAFLKSEGIE